MPHILQKQVIWYQPEVVCRYGAFVCRAAAGRLEALRHRLLVTETLEPLWKNTRGPQQNDKQGQRWKHRQMDGQTDGWMDEERDSRVKQQEEARRKILVPKRHLKSQDGCSAGSEFIFCLVTVALKMF